jgi:hypothetical protein
MEERKLEGMEKEKRVKEEEGERKSMVARGGALHWQSLVTYQGREHLSSPYPVPLPFRLPHLQHYPESALKRQLPPLRPH